MKNSLKPGTIIDGCRVIDRPAFCGLLPYAEITSGSNKGVVIILVQHKIESS